jgi:hypothetical protein
MQGQTGMAMARAAGGWLSGHPAAKVAAMLAVVILALVPSAQAGPVYQICLVQNPGWVLFWHPWKRRPIFAIWLNCGLLRKGLVLVAGLVEVRSYCCWKCRLLLGFWSEKAGIVV